MDGENGDRLGLGLLNVTLEFLGILSYITSRDWENE